MLTFILLSGSSCSVFQIWLPDVGCLQSAGNASHGSTIQARCGDVLLRVEVFSQTGQWTPHNPAQVLGPFPHQEPGPRISGVGLPSSQSSHAAACRCTRSQRIPGARPGSIHCQPGARYHGPSCWLCNSPPAHQVRRNALHEHQATAQSPAIPVPHFNHVSQAQLRAPERPPI